MCTESCLRPTYFLWDEPRSRRGVVAESSRSNLFFDSQNGGVVAESSRSRDMVTYFLWVISRSRRGVTYFLIVGMAESPRHKLSER